MKKCFHRESKKGPYFEGWYFKCQGKDGKSMALIPAFHIDRGSRLSTSIQVISGDGTWWLEYPEQELLLSQTQLRIQVGPNVFSEEGLNLNINQPGIRLQGELRFGPFLPLKYDIMGPFRFLPHMECTHGVISMMHSLQGKLTLNHTVMDFSGGTGYIETDRGSSFPSAYLWTQGSWPGGSLMLSIATIPYCHIRFTGCICAIIHNKTEYRMATYRGANVEQWSEYGAVIRQGKYRLSVELLENSPHPLRAPMNGYMERTIHESLRAKLRYRFWNDEKLLLDHTDCSASFEYSRS